jgi:hypothetical protein
MLSSLKKDTESGALKNRLMLGKNYKEKIFMATTKKTSTSRKSKLSPKMALENKKEDNKLE